MTSSVLKSKALFDFPLLLLLREALRKHFPAIHTHIPVSCLILPLTVLQTV